MVRNHKKKGITFIELLVVVSIIALLIGIGSISYNSAQKKARDTKRKSDVKYIQSVAEQYYATCGQVYPFSDGPIPTLVCPNPSNVIAPTIPTDPKTGASYICTSCTSTAFTICPTLEVDSGFCVSNQQ